MKAILDDMRGRLMVRQELLEGVVIRPRQLRKEVMRNECHIRQDIEEVRALSPKKQQQLRELPDGGLLNAEQDSGLLLAPESTDPEERDRLLGVVLRNMRLNPLPAVAPRFTRDELHERS